MAARHKRSPKRQEASRLKMPSSSQRRTSRSSAKDLRRWRRHVRPEAVRDAVSATKGLRWSRQLINAVLEELYVGDYIEDLLSKAPDDLQVQAYPQALAVALLLRHSWSPDDLVSMIERLGLRPRPK
jgi:hypothetical protein